MTENTTTETPEKKTTSLSARTKEAWRKAHHRLGTGGVVAVVLAVILFFTIVSHGHRISRLEHNSRGQYGMMKHGFNARYDRGGFPEMDLQRDGRRVFMQTQMALPVNRDERAVPAPIENKVTNYTIQSRDNVVTGTFISSDVATLERQKNALEKIGLEVAIKNNQLQFTGSEEQFAAAVKILNTK